MKSWRKYNLNTIKKEIDTNLREQRGISFEMSHFDRHPTNKARNNRMSHFDRHKHTIPITMYLTWSHKHRNVTK
jgi:hypothetical protein